MERALLDMLSQQSEGVALAVADVEGRITMTTPALRTMLGRDLESLDPEELGAFTLRDPVDDRPLGISELPLVRACAGEVVRDEVLSLLRPDGLLLYLRCSAAPLRGEHAELQGAIALVQDVTAEWTLTAKQTELRERLVRTVNHELRTPLTKILGHCELLGEVLAEDGDSLPAHVVSSVRAIERAGRELAHLAQRVTDLADLETATQVELAPADLGALVQQEVEAVRAREVSAGIDIQVEVSEDLEVTVDGRLVRLAVRELLENAVHHAPPSSRVLVTVLGRDGHLDVTVADEGPGIPAADRERVLRPFERGRTEDPSASSPGLGLAVVSAVAAAHGGAVLLEDHPPHGLLARLTLLRRLV